MPACGLGDMVAVGGVEPNGGLVATVSAMQTPLLAPKIAAKMASRSPPKN